METCTRLFNVPFVVVDLETTGLSPATDRITEIGAVRVRGGERRGELHTLVDPGRAIPPGVTSVTGITDAMVAGHPTVEAVLPTFLEFARDAVIVAHNARFDVGFLDAELARAGYPPLDHTVVDTARLARRLLRSEVRDVRLDTLATYLRARVRPCHRALADARATVDVLHGLLERAGTLGATTLEDLQTYLQTRADRSFRKIGLVRDAPHAPGTYRFVGPRDEILYIGKATDLRDRLRQYFGQDDRRRVDDLLREVTRIEWDVTATELEASVREVRAIHAHRPRYNRRSRNPERSVYVKLTRERFPRLSIVTRVRDDGACYVGPVVSRRAAEELVAGVHDVTGLRQCTPRLRAAQDHPACLLKDLGRCGAPCDGTQSVAAYGEVAARVRRALTDDPAPLLAAVRTRMDELAARARYERAGSARRRLHTLATVLATSRRVAALAGVAELCAAREVDGGDEVVLVRHGRLVASARVTRPWTLADVQRRLAGAPPPASTGLPDRHEIEEVQLVDRWLQRADVVPLWVDGTHACSVAGGRELSATCREHRTVARAVHRDRQLASGQKVVRRDGQTSSNHGVKTSGSSAEDRGSRPSQVTRIR